MVFEAQDLSRIVDLNHLIDSRKVFIDDLMGLVSDLQRLVGRRHKLHMRIVKRISGGVLNSATSPWLPPREMIDPTRGVFVPNVVHKSPDALIILFSTDLLELG